MNTQETLNLDRLTTELNHKTQEILGNKLQKIILFGSYARGDYTEHSDIDLMVLADYEETERRTLEKAMVRLASYASLDYDITVSITLNTEDFVSRHIHLSPFYRNVLSEGVEIYANN